MGTPQGAVISPTLANVYLHYVLDLWVQEWRRCHARGEVIIVRYADDTVMGFEHRTEAVRFLADLEKRVAEHALALHPDKTRLIEFGRFAAANRKGRGLGKPETFDFLGFTHICGRTRTGRFQVRRRSRRDRMRVKLQVVKEELRRRMHASVAEQGQWLASVVRGYFQYHGVPNNGDAWRPSATMLSVFGTASFVGAATRTRQHGTGSIASLRGGCPGRASPIPGPISVSPSPTRGGSRMRGALGEAGMSLPVQVWSVQSLASRTGASLTGVTATWGPERRQWSDGVWD
jgi:hypothetical protein